MAHCLASFGALAGLHDEVEDVGGERISFRNGATEKSKLVFRSSSETEARQQAGPRRPTLFIPHANLQAQASRSANKNKARKQKKRGVKRKAKVVLHDGGTVLIETTASQMGMR